MSKPHIAILGLGTMAVVWRGACCRRVLQLLSSTATPTGPRRWSTAALFSQTLREKQPCTPKSSSAWYPMMPPRGCGWGESGALADAKSGAVLIESSTLTVGWIKELAAAAATRGCEFLDAPVTGSKPHAESGELLFLVGGSARAFENAKPVFVALGRGAVHLGATGSGALLKLTNNFLAAVQAASFAEALALIDAGGLDRERGISILTEGVPGSPMLKRVASRVASDDFTPHFLMRLMAKDVSYALQEAKERGIHLQTAAAALAEFGQAIEDGHGEEDFTAVARWLTSHRASRVKNSGSGK
jgi:3-hydroxyisobutyrate dehydrogenase